MHAQKSMNIILPLILTFIISVGLIEMAPTGAGDSKWGYIPGHGLMISSEWKSIFPTCGGDRQSPINIQTDKVQYSDHLKPIIITKTDPRHSDVSLEKHTTSIYLKFSKNWKITFGDEKCLKPISIHWHWGAANCQGSEHMLDGHSYPIEGHLVSYNCEKYDNAKTAVSSPNGLYVIGFFYQIGTSNPGLETVLNHIDQIILKNTTNVTIAEISPADLLPRNLKQYYQYDGSLTTPPCTENVRWTVLKEITTMSEEQLNRFRDLEFELPETGKMVNNFRAPVPIHGKRVVMSSFKGTLALSANIINVILGIIGVFIIIRQ